MCSSDLRIEGALHCGLGLFYPPDQNAVARENMPTRSGVCVRSDDQIGVRWRRVRPSSHDLGNAASNYRCITPRTAFASTTTTTANTKTTTTTTITALLGATRNTGIG